MLLAPFRNTCRAAHETAVKEASSRSTGSRMSRPSGACAAASVSAMLNEAWKARGGRRRSRKTWDLKKKTS